ncbi:hypothetical protein V8C40DRAFT_229249 [Trichoderma camerunense]
MHLPQTLQQSIVILALATPTLSCVQFSINYICPNTVLGTCWNNYVANAALTDNGTQVCSLVNKVGPVPDCKTFTLNCIGDYKATFDGVTVNYSYASFSGSFGVTQSKSGDYCYYTANVWGC